MNRTTTNLDVLQQQLLTNIMQGIVANSNMIVQDESDDDEDNYIPIHLIDNDKKSFNKFILDTFNEIQHYYKYTIIVEEFGEEGDYQQIPEELQKLKKYGLSCEEYLKRIKGSCLKNGCEEIMLNCLKTMQYFEKN